MIVLLSVYWVLNVGYEFDYSHAIVRVTFLRWPASVHESTGAWRRQERYNTRASTSKRGKRKSRTLPSSPPFAENSSLLAERAVRGMRAESVKKKNLYIYIYIYIPTYIHTYIYIEREREGEREREWDIDVPCSWGGCDSRMTCVCVCSETCRLPTVTNQNGGYNAQQQMEQKLTASSCPKIADKKSEMVGLRLWHQAAFVL